MATHQVKLALNTNMVEVANKDVEIAVRRNGQRLGTVLISRGNIEWRPAKKSIKKYRFTWAKFADRMEYEGKKVRAKRRVVRRASRKPGTHARSR